jgi:hypothetical protein
MRDKHLRRMAASGLTGFTFFLIANFTDVFVGLDVAAGILQLFVNTFVLVVWAKAFRESVGLKRFIAFFGIVVPIGMAAVTTCRVLLPAFFSSI